MAVSITEYLQDEDTSTTGQASSSTTGPIQTAKWVSIGWTYNEPLPAGSCKGFEVALCTEGSASPESGILVIPIETTKADARHFIKLLELRSTQNLVAFVRAIYQSPHKSAWMASGVSVFTPNQRDYSNPNGYQKLPDGTIIQWGVVKAVGAGEVGVLFPLAFPHGVYSVVTGCYGGSASVVAGSRDWTVTGFTLVNAGAIENRDWNWMAIGY